MSKERFTMIILSLGIAIISILFINSKGTISSQKTEISNLESKNNALELKISDLESTNQTLETKIQNFEEVQRNTLSSINTIKRNSLGSNGTTVVYKKLGCDYFILENNMGFIVAEWFGGHDPDSGEILLGNFNSYGMKDFYTVNNTSSHLWIEDYMLSKDEAFAKLEEQCK